MVYVDMIRIHKRIVEDSNGCWIWTGSTTDGYGKVAISGRVKYVHRVVYEAAVGPIPKGLQLDHLCRVRNCCNPAHLEPVTPGTNIRRSAQGWFLTGRCRSGKHDVTLPEAVRMHSGKPRCRECSREYQRRRRAHQFATSRQDQP